MKIIAFVFVVFVLLLQKTAAQDCVGANPKEKRVLRLINSLPEVVAENKYRTKAHIKLLLKAYIQNTPTKESDYYSVSVSEDLGFQLRTYDWYEVNPDNYTIRYLDIPSGKSISLKQWRAQLRKRGTAELKKS